MSRAHNICAALAALLWLAACSGGADRPPGNLQVIEAMRAVATARLAPKVERPPLTRAALDTLEGAFLEVTVENRDALAYLFVQLQRRDSLPGLITVWRTEDDATMAMRNGVLIATRGFGGDLLSSSTEVAEGRPGPAGSGQRLMQIRTRDNKQVALAMACDLADLGPEIIVIVERRHPTRHLQETCEGGGGRVVNDYWVDSRSGLVWQSRQWGGPYVGYVRTRQLTN